MIPRKEKTPMLTIDFLTDYVCPFCLVTKENLRAALKTLHREAEIIEHPYALTPEGSDPTDICDEEHRAYFARLKEPAETVGLNMQLPPEIRPRPMTYLAFEGAVLADKAGRHEAWSDRVYRAYWVEGRDIGQIDVLCMLAADIGLNADEMRQALENRTYADDVKAASSTRWTPIIRAACRFCSSMGSAFACGRTRWQK